MNNPTTTCRDCGKTVFQHRGLLYVPIEGMLLTGQMVGPERPVERFVYVPHACEDSDVDNYAKITAVVVAELERLRSERESPWDQADYLDAQKAARGTYEELRALIAEHSLERECPKCSAAVGHPCMNLTQRRSGNDVPTINPHQERVPDIEARPQSELYRMRSRLVDEQSLVQRIYESLIDQEALERLIHDARKGSRHSA